MRLSLTLALVCAAFVVAGCGAAPKTTATSASGQPSDPKAVPTATLPAVLPSPIPAGTVTEGGITGQASTDPTTYVVKSGDTMAAIAQKVGVPLSVLQSYNTDVNPSRLIVGQELKVPPAPTATTLSTSAPLRPATSTPQGGSAVPRTATANVASTPSSSTPSSAGGAQTYTVQSGDTACNVAAKFNVSLQELAAANGVTPASLASLRIGQDLKVPPASSSPRGC
ncbi:MAG TPA: LysM peptidoglycan-binding domain-containing protein [Dehalococcoidia bacterium]|nr:LysM peptidoglycan-binding domain-containing protein [Dehalococcoidia bacterium]